MTFVNDNFIEDSKVKEWIDNEEYFGGVKNGEEVFIAFLDDNIQYSGFFEFHFIKKSKDHNKLEKKDYDLEFLIISRNTILGKDMKHYVSLSDINHIYTKEYLKNVVLKNLD